MYLMYLVLWCVKSASIQLAVPCKTKVHIQNTVLRQAKVSCGMGKTTVSV